MQKGLRLDELAKEIMDMEANKKDMIAPTEKLRTVVAVLEDKPTVKLMVDEGEEENSYPILQNGHDQIADRMQIPRKYYRKMQENSPALLTTNINHWFKKEPKKQMVRTMKGEVRAFLSDKYRPYDNFLVAEAVLPVLKEQNLKIISCQLTETNMYIKVVNEELIGEVKAGDIVQRGTVIRNSETGHGAASFEDFMYSCWCDNGGITGVSMRKNHVGRAIGTGNEVEGDFYQRDTIIADANAFQLKLRDMVKNAFNKERWELELEQYRIAAERKVTKAPIDLAKDVTKRYSLTEGEQGSFLSTLLKDQEFRGLTQWGVGNAVTAIANEETVPYDRVVQLERIGGNIFGLSGKEFNTLAA